MNFSGDSARQLIRVLCLFSQSQLEMAARITQQVVDMQSQLKYKDEELVKHKEEGLSH